MFTFIGHLFTILIYQPFFNLLVFIYWLLGIGGGTPDMGVAVIILSFLIRIILLPTTIAADKTERQRHEIGQKLKELEKKYANEPIRFKEERKKLMKRSKGAIFSEVLNLGIQIIVALMLWRIFKTGLEGKDIHLIYSWMPEVKLPFNLMFLGKYDLSKPSFTLNLIQSIAIFIFEAILAVSSPYRVSRKDVVRMQLVLPVVSFLIFMFLPSGKKLFIITSLAFSIGFHLIKIARHQWHRYTEKKLDQAQAEAS